MIEKVYFYKKYMINITYQPDEIESNVQVRIVSSLESKPLAKLSSSIEDLSNISEILKLLTLSKIIIDEKIIETIKENKFSILTDSLFREVFDDES